MAAALNAMFFLGFHIVGARKYEDQASTVGLIIATALPLINLDADDSCPQVSHRARAHTHSFFTHTAASFFVSRLVEIFRISNFFELLLLLGFIFVLSFWGFI